MNILIAITVLGISITILALCVIALVSRIKDLEVNVNQLIKESWK